MNGKTLENFFESSPGSLLRRWEAAYMDAFVSQLTGEKALQIAGPYAKCLRNSKHKLRCSLSLDSEEMQNTHYEMNVLADMMQLPFEEKTWDLVVVFHVLERIEDTERFIKEVHRVLEDEGRVVVFGINSHGPWWVRRKEKLIDPTFHALNLYKTQILMRKYFVLEEGRFGVYCPSLSDSPNQLARWKWIEKAGDRWWPSFSNAFVLIGKKESANLKMVGRIQTIVDELKPELSSGLARVVH